jgi:hypothetical protein
MRELTREEMSVVAGGEKGGHGGNAVQNNIPIAVLSGSTATTRQHNVSFEGGRGGNA